MSGEPDHGILGYSLEMSRLVLAACTQHLLHTPGGTGGRAFTARLVWGPFIGVYWPNKGTWTCIGTQVQVAFCLKIAGSQQYLGEILGQTPLCLTVCDTDPGWLENLGKES